jgi:hypothetical protein
MTIAITIIVIIFVLTFVSWDTTYGLVYRNKCIVVTKVDDENISGYGGIYNDQKKLKMCFLWTKKIKVYSEIKTIKAFETVDFGLENHYKNLIIEFQDGDTLIFNASRPSHRDFIDKILIDLKATAANWKTEFSPSLDKQKKDVLYEKTTSANSG